MPKMKTKSSVKKRFKLTGTGKIVRTFAGTQHNMRKRPQKMLRQARGTTILAKSDERMIRRLMPYG